MGKRETIGDKGETVPSGDAVVEAPPPVEVGRASDTPKMALAAIDAPEIDVAKIDTLKIDAPKIAIPQVATLSIDSLSIDSPSIALARLDAPNLAPNLEAPSFDLPHDEIPVVVADIPTPPGAVADTAPAAAAPHESASSRNHRFPLLAASLVLAASLGAMVGSLVSTSLLVRSAPAPAVVAAKSGIEEVQALKEQVVQLRVDLAALKTSIEAGHRTASAQFTRIGERVDRIDRTQAEPVAKLTKAIEAFERRADLGAARETTGSITPPQPIAGQPAKPSGVVEGWVLRDVQRGTALIEGRLGMIEVDQGDVVPGLGRIDAIRKQDGRWVVVTSKGLIVSPR